MFDLLVFVTSCREGLFSFCLLHSRCLQVCMTDLSQRSGVVFLPFGFVGDPQSDVNSPSQVSNFSDSTDLKHRSSLETHRYVFQGLRTPTHDWTWTHTLLTFSDPFLGNPSLPLPVLLVVSRVSRSLSITTMVGLTFVGNFTVRNPSQVSFNNSDITSVSSGWGSL